MIQINLSPKAEQALKALAASGEDTSRIVETAILELAVQRDSLPREFFDPVSKANYGIDELQQRVNVGLEDLREGRVSEIDLQAELEKVLSERTTNEADAK
ncbi:hypothetical protein [Calycomorphotria hydatis]|uniref:Uncharacterized protein n=1 Tax=Calycomorphotria hydatis TaxID=2528027 RepID=A0A517TAA2_9PLAN|nr:hypothetical protein [Calycomorphotria hydatis]QDT65298.1 hypothetical protein V22_25460 [Calycomorphotria hydatis]